MMASKSAMDFLYRQRVFSTPPTLHEPFFATNSLHSHFRPVKPHPCLLGPDTPASRVVTQKEEDRVPYLPVVEERPCKSSKPCC
jgi:hypothetical protein